MRTLDAHPLIHCQRGLTFEHATQSNCQVDYYVNCKPNNINNSDLTHALTFIGKKEDRNATNYNNLEVYKE